MTLRERLQKIHDSITDDQNVTVKEYRNAEGKNAPGGEKAEKKEMPVNTTEKVELKKKG